MKTKSDQTPDINDMLDRLAQMTQKVNSYIQGNGNSKKLKKKAQKACDLASRSKEN